MPILEAFDNLESWETFHEQLKELTHTWPVLKLSYSRKLNSLKYLTMKVFFKQVEKNLPPTTFFTTISSDFEGTLERAQEGMRKQVSNWIQVKNNLSINNVAKGVFLRYCETQELKTLIFSRNWLQTIFKTSLSSLSYEWFGTEISFVINQITIIVNIYARNAVTLLRLPSVEVRCPTCR